MFGINFFVIVAVAAWLAGFGAAAAMLAIRRRREPGTWAFFGAVLGPAALALLSAAPPGRCWRCAAPTEGWLTLCPWCGEDVREPGRDLPVTDRPVKEVRTPTQLTVIEGSARRVPRLSRIARETQQAGSSYASAPASSTVPANVRAVPTDAAPTSVPTPRGVDAAPRERRIDLTTPPPLGEQARRMPAATAAAASAAAAAASIEPAPDPVRRLKASLGRSTQSLNAATASVPALEIHLGPDAEPRSFVLASAIYVTGSRGLQAGSRYGISLHGDDLRILGPVDVDPSAVALRHALRGMDATGLQGRLIITATDGRRDQLALVFMSVAGGSPEGVADAIIAAAHDLETDAR